MNKFIYDENTIVAVENGMDVWADIMVTFVVEIDGTLSNIQILGKGYKEKYNNEVIRIVSKMPRWIPGVLDGKKVRCRKGIVVSFPPIY